MTSGTAAPRTAREALIAELLGDVDSLLQRTEALQATLTGAEDKLATTATALNDAGDRYRLAVTAFTEEARGELTQFLERKASAIATATVDEQRAALKEAARAAFRFEASDRAAQLAQALANATASLRRTSLTRWLEILATSIVTSALTAGLIVHFAK